MELTAGHPPRADDSCLAFIVGGNRFQNTLLADHIESRTGWKANIVSSLGSIPCDGHEGNGSRTAVLFDCYDMAHGDLRIPLAEVLGDGARQKAMALFNLDREQDIETWALHRGVQGFFYRDDSTETFMRGLTTLFGGEFWVSRQKLAEAVQEMALLQGKKPGGHCSYPQELTQREVDILGQLASGASNRAIAEKLFISPHTVRTHLGHIFRKIHASGRVEASLWASSHLTIRRTE